jgi:hypothetical protein
MVVPFNLRLGAKNMEKFYLIVHVFENNFYELLEIQRLG